MELITHAVALLVGTLAGAKGLPLAVAWFKKQTAAHTIATAKALIARAEADAKALEAARRVIAAAPVAPTPPKPPANPASAQEST